MSATEVTNLGGDDQESQPVEKLKGKMTKEKA
jgi:hypothetical protein